MHKNNTDLICKVEKIANGKATLFLEEENKTGKISCQKIEVSKSILPKRTSEDEKLVLKFLTLNDAQKKQKELAKDILNEILDIK